MSWKTTKASEHLPHPNTLSTCKQVHSLHTDETLNQTLRCTHEIACHRQASN
ncbi:hypothetical protein LguiA_029174 [Lonicera macranthoides]